jgi:hypothetical protein
VPESAGVRAIDSERAMGNPDYGSSRIDSTGTWGGVQVPDIQTAPQFELPGLQGRRP